MELELLLSSAVRKCNNVFLGPGTSQLAHAPRNPFKHADVHHQIQAKKKKAKATTLS